MNTPEAVALIAAAVPRRPGTWADVGAGNGTFTRALAQSLGPGSRIYAIDRDARAVAALERWAAKEAVNVIAVAADFARPFALPGLKEPRLDGILLANSLHFVPEAATYSAGSPHGCAPVVESYWSSTTSAPRAAGYRIRSR